MYILYTLRALASSMFNPTPPTCHPQPLYQFHTPTQEKTYQIPVQLFAQMGAQLHGANENEEQSQ